MRIPSSEFGRHRPFNTMMKMKPMGIIVIGVTFFTGLGHLIWVLAHSRPAWCQHEFPKCKSRNGQHYHPKRSCVACQDHSCNIQAEYVKFICGICFHFCMVYLTTITKLIYSSVY